MKYKFFILLLAFVLLMTGCSNEDKCIKSHKETQMCVMYHTFPNSNAGVRMVPFFYPCEKEICDLYESEVAGDE